jgi:hypothetical protein
MKKLILTVILICFVFSLGVLADEAIRPTGSWWYKISDARRLGYVEGFVDGEMSSMLEAHCEKTTLPALQATGTCILYKFRQDTMLDTNTSETLETMMKFYALPQNLPIRWEHAVVISRAIASGVPVAEKDLQAIRQEDAKFSATLITK